VRVEENAIVKPDVRGRERTDARVSIQEIF
jgi:hypothetical protein